MPSRSLVPALSSSTQHTGASAAMDLSEPGVVSRAMFTMTPLPRTNSMSSGMTVFFIHIDTRLGCS